MGDIGVLVADGLGGLGAMRSGLGHGVTVLWLGSCFPLLKGCPDPSNLCTPSA